MQIDVVITFTRSNKVDNICSTNVKNFSYNLISLVYNVLDQP